MYKDPTEFRKRVKAYRKGKPVKELYQAGRPIPIQKVDESNADFAKRLRSNWKQEIWDWEGSGKAATHKMSSADNIVYPNVQTTKGGGLIDFTHPMWKGVVDPLERAIRNKDYVPMKTEDDAIWAGSNYKKYYPGFKYGKEPLPKFGLGTKGGYTRLNGNPVAFDEEGNLIDQVTGLKGTMMLPEVVVTPRRYDAYHSVYSFNPNNVWKYFLPNDAKKLYNTIDPNYPYGGISAYLDYHLGTNNRKSVMQRDIDTGFSNKDLANIFYNSTEAAFAKYLGLTDKDFLTKSGIKNDKISNYFLPADYTPAKGRTYKNIYKLVHPVGINESSNGDDLIPLLNDYIFAQMVERGKGKSINAISSSLKDAGMPVDTLKINRNYDPIITGTHAFNNITGGDYTIGLGNDANGPYISYYDEYDLNSGIFGQHKLGDIGMSISNPFSLYDRKYFTKDDSTRIVNAYRKFGEKAFDKFGKLRPLQRMNSE